MPPKLLANFFPGGDGNIAPELKFLAKENDWQTLIGSFDTFKIIL